MVIIILITFILLAVVWVFVRDWKVAALLVTFFLVLFFSYGHIQEAFADTARLGYPKHRLLLPIWIAIFVVGSLLLLRFGPKLRGFTNPLNVMGLVLIILTIPNIVTHEPITDLLSADKVSINPVPEVVGQGNLTTKPDIYYITTEGYSSTRTYQKNLGYDNTPFINFLKSRGFYVAEDSSSNHSRTVLSLASALSMETLEYLTPEDIDNTYGYYHILIDNKVTKLLKAQGYRMIYLRERYAAKGDYSGGDLYFGCEGVGRVALHAEGFSGALLHTTVLEPFLRKFAFLEADKRFLRSCDFAQLIESKSLDGPKMVIIHLLGPGKAFLVGVDTVADHLEQLDFTNEGLSRVVHALTSDPEYSPIIVIQGDHGEGSFYGTEGSTATEPDTIPSKMGIINAYHLPDGGDKLLYPNISPVNTFRVIFNYYLGGNYDLVEDKLWFSTGKAFEFQDVTEIMKQANTEWHNMATQP